MFFQRVFFLDNPVNSSKLLLIWLLLLVMTKLFTYKDNPLICEDSLWMYVDNRVVHGDNQDCNDDDRHMYDESRCIYDDIP